LYLAHLKISNNEQIVCYLFYQLQLCLYFHVQKNNDSAKLPPREYSVQYAADLSDEEYLKTYYIEVTIQVL
jgi:hypothetical protein